MATATSRRLCRRPCSPDAFRAAGCRRAATWWYFACPGNTDTDYIKRVIGLPGDKIQVIDGVVSINGVPVKHEPAPPFIETEEGTRAAPVKRWKDTLPEGVSFYT